MNDMTEYLKLAKAIENARTIPPCMNTDPELFFPEKGEYAQPAKKLCAQCPVAKQCLEYAMNTNQYTGIWGGTSPDQRKHMRRDRNLAKRYAA